MLVPKKDPTVLRPKKTSMGQIQPVGHCFANCGWEQWTLNSWGFSGHLGLEHYCWGSEAQGLCPGESNPLCSPSVGSISGWVVKGGGRREAGGSFTVLGMVLYVLRVGALKILSYLPATPWLDPCPEYGAMTWKSWPVSCREWFMNFWWHQSGLQRWCFMAT